MFLFMESLSRNMIISKTEISHMSVFVIHDIYFYSFEKVSFIHIFHSIDSQVWNIQRPPWHHALVQLIAPSVVGVVAEVCSIKMICLGAFYFFLT